MKTHIAATALAIPLLLNVTAHADTPQKPAMNVALGLWEVTTTGDQSGAPVIPDSVLARLTPEQQARMQAMMAKRSQPKKYRSCMTAQKLDQGFEKDGQEGADSQCKLTVITNSSSEYVADKQCRTGGGIAYDAKVHFNITGGKQTTGTVDVVITQADGKVSNLHRTIQAQWLSADCGNIKDIELEK